MPPAETEEVMDDMMEEEQCGSHQFYDGTKK